MLRLASRWLTRIPTEITPSYQFFPIIQKRYVFKKLQKYVTDKQGNKEFGKFIKSMIDLPTFTLDDYKNLLHVMQIIKLGANKSSKATERHTRRSETEHRRCHS